MEEQKTKIKKEVFTEEEAKAMMPIMQDFIELFASYPEKNPEEYLIPKMKQYLPEKSDKEIYEIVMDICNAIKEAEVSQKSLQEARKQGKSAKSWFSDQCKQAVTDMDDTQKEEYLNSVKEATDKVNEQLCEDVMEIIDNEDNKDE